MEKRILDVEEVDQIENILSIKYNSIELAHMQQYLRLLYEMYLREVATVDIISNISGKKRATVSDCPCGDFAVGFEPTLDAARSDHLKLNQSTTRLSQK